MSALESWKEEKRSAYLYRSLSTIEANPVHQKLFLDLSELAEKQASIWAEQLKAARATVPDQYKPDLRARVVIWLVQCFGSRSLSIALSAMKIRGMSLYHCADGSHPIPTATDGLESRHGSISRGNNIRAAVFGINDGLISNASLILGIAGASVGNQFILISGIAGLLAGACSMGAGEYVSVRSQREMLEYQLDLERSELELYPEEEQLELSLIYQARGVPKADADNLAALLIKDPEKALDTLAREELGINPNDLISPWGAAISSFISFGIGAFIPLIPFLMMDSKNNIFYTIGLTALSLFIVGSILSLFTQRSAWWGGLRMLMIGAMAGVLTFLIGSLFGVKA